MIFQFLIPSCGQKFNQLFNEEQKQYILQQLSTANLEFSEKLAKLQMRKSESTLGR